MKAYVEVTDTFGGEANYCWVRRYTVEGATERAIVRKAKALEGWQGWACRKDDFGDTVALYPRGACIVMFINFGE